MTYPLPSTGRTKQAARDAKERFDLENQTVEGKGMTGRVGGMGL